MGQLDSQRVQPHVRRRVRQLCVREARGAVTSHLGGGVDPERPPAVAAAAAVNIDANVSPAVSSAVSELRLEPREVSQELRAVAVRVLHLKSDFETGFSRDRLKGCDSGGGMNKSGGGGGLKPGAFKLYGSTGCKCVQPPPRRWRG
jgi:hypothetical protein